MCVNTSSVRSLSEWNWDGDTIVQAPVIPACRTIPGTAERYEIDIREFVGTEDNAVIRATLGEIEMSLPSHQRAYFRSRRPGSFDFRAQAIIDFISRNITYDNRKEEFNAWLFPDETLRLRCGDCEDRAFLLAALLRGSGISGYVIRVALGKVRDAATNVEYDHAWVMYKAECGMWLLLEPQVMTPESRRISAEMSSAEILSPNRTAEGNRVEYRPFFLFNDAHLWCVLRTTRELGFLDFLASRAFWNQIDPKFGTEVHSQIYDEALSGMSWIRRNWVKAMSLSLDASPLYDPRDHFDDGYIAEGWDLVGERLSTGGLTDFAHATHAIADFYAHSSYAHFADTDADGIIPCNGRDGVSVADPRYRYDVEPFNLLDRPRFLPNSLHCRSTVSSMVAQWNGFIISGRYAQPGDQHPKKFGESLLRIPSAMLDRPDYASRTCLPHHDAIAVDGVALDGLPDQHRLYANRLDYNGEYLRRRNASIRHIRGVFEWWRQRNA